MVIAGFAFYIKRSFRDHVFEVLQIDNDLRVFISGRAISVVVTSGHGHKALVVDTRYFSGAKKNELGGHAKLNELKKNDHDYYKIPVLSGFQQTLKKIKKEHK